MDLALDVLDLLKLVAQLDDREVDHAWVKTESAADGCLNGAGGVEAHDEVVAFAVASLVLGGDLGQTERAPVGVAADDAAGPDNLDTGVTGDSVDDISSSADGGSGEPEILLRNVLSNLLEAARADLLTETRTLVFNIKSSPNYESGICTYNGNQLVQHCIEW